MTLRKSTSRTAATGASKTAKSTRARSTTKPKSAAMTKARSAASKTDSVAKSAAKAGAGQKPATPRKTLKLGAGSDAAKTATTKAIPAAETPEPMVVDKAKPVVAGEMLRKKEFLDAVAEQSGIKRRDVKAALEAALPILGKAIADGRLINLPGFGKLKVTRTKMLANGQIYMTRIRQPIVQAGPGTGSDGDKHDESDAPMAVKDPLAEAAE